MKFITIIKSSYQFSIRAFIFRRQFGEIACNCSKVFYNKTLLEFNIATAFAAIHPLVHAC